MRKRKNSRTSWKTDKLFRVCQDLEQGLSFVTRTAIALGELGITNSCREYTHPRDQHLSYPKSTGKQHQKWTCSGSIGHIAMWALRNQGRNWFIANRWIGTWCRHQQVCSTLCDGELRRLQRAQKNRHEHTRWRAT